MKAAWILLIGLTPGVSQAAPAAADPALARGAHIALRDCSACHAVALADRSPNPGAPPFSVLRLRYNPISLERRLATFPRFGHEAMPPRSLAETDVADLAAYIQSLTPAPDAP